jgi:hypothetical protein
MTGYWRNILDAGHKTGPYRTSIQAVRDYEETYESPFGENFYKTAGFNKKMKKVKRKGTMLSPMNMVGIPLNSESTSENNESPISSSVESQ